MNNEKTFGIIARIMKVPADQINETSSPETVPQWDSLKHIQLILAIEEAFGLQFADQEIVGIKDVRSLLSLLRQKTGA